MCIRTERQFALVLGVFRREGQDGRQCGGGARRLLRIWSSHRKGTPAPSNNSNPERMTTPVTRIRETKTWLAKDWEDECLDGKKWLY